MVWSTQEHCSVSALPFLSQPKSHLQPAQTRTRQFKTGQQSHRKRHSYLRTYCQHQSKLQADGIVLSRTLPHLKVAQVHPYEPVFSPLEQPHLCVMEQMSPLSLCLSDSYSQIKYLVYYHCSEEKCLKQVMYLGWGKTWHPDDLKCEQVLPFCPLILLPFNCSFYDMLSHIFRHKRERQSDFSHPSTLQTDSSSPLQ